MMYMPRPFNVQQGSSKSVVSHQRGAMSINPSGLPKTFCFGAFEHLSKGSSAYYPITLAACVVIAVLAPITVAANAFVLAAIWKNPSLRTPSYVLLAGLAVTDAGTGLLTQPAYVVTTVSELAGNTEINCLANQIGLGLAYYFSLLTAFVIMLSSVERWLYMSRRSLLTVRRVVIIYIMAALFQLLIVVAGAMCIWYFRNKYWFEIFAKLVSLNLWLVAILILVTAFAYFKVFQIIRHHQRQVQTNESNLDMRKYKKTLFTILYILAIFALCYAPILCWALTFHILQEDNEISKEVYSICTALLFSSSFFNPLLYYWRIKEIRDGVRRDIRKYFCKQNGEEA